MNFKGMKEIRIRMTLIEEALGMMPSVKEIHEEYIASKAPDAEKIEEEVAALGVEPVVEKGTTVFPRMDDGRPFMWDYQIRGMFKDAIGMLRRIKDSESAKVKNYKKVIDGLLFVKERRIPFEMSGEFGDCQRPLRADTLQGPRVALAHSETVPAGSTLEFTLLLMDGSIEKAVRECLDYGVLRGIAQWRNSGKGTFYWDELDADGNVIGGNGEEYRRA